MVFESELSRDAFSEKLRGRTVKTSLFDFGKSAEGGFALYEKGDYFELRCGKFNGQASFCGKMSEKDGKCLVSGGFHLGRGPRLMLAAVLAAFVIIIFAIFRKPIALAIALFFALMVFVFELFISASVSGAGNAITERFMKEELLAGRIKR